MMKPARASKKSRLVRSATTIVSERPRDFDMSPLLDFYPRPPEADNVDQSELNAPRKYKT